MHGQQVHECRRRVHAIRAARAHGGAKVLGEPQQAEIADVHLFPSDGQAVTVDDAADAGMFGGVDQDIDAMRDFSSHVGHRLAVGDIQGNDLDVWDGAQSCFSWKRFPGIGDANEHQRCAGSGQRAGHRLPGGVAAVGYKHPAELRIAGQLSQLHIILLMACRAAWHRQRDRIAAFVQTERHVDAVAFVHVAVQMRNEGRATIQFDRADAPGCAFAEIDVGAGADCRFGQHRSAGGDVLERHSRRPAAGASITWRIHSESTVGADLQGETTLGRRGSQPVRGTAANALRQQRLPRFLQRILATRTRQWFCHARANNTAELANPRS